MRRHIMQLTVNGDRVVIETIPEPPAGYAVKVWRGMPGDRQIMISDEILRSTDEAAKVFTRECRRHIDELAVVESKGVPMNRRPLITIEEEE